MARTIIALPIPPSVQVIAYKRGNEDLLVWIPGQQPRKSNARVISRNRRTGKPFVRKSDKALAWTELVVATMPKKARLEMGSRLHPLRIDFCCIYRTNASDLSVELALDALQKARVISDDRYVFETHATKIIQKEWQGVLVRVCEMEESVGKETLHKMWPKEATNRFCAG